MPPLYMFRIGVSRVPFTTISFFMMKNGCSILCMLLNLNHRLNNNKPRRDTTFGPSEALNCWISQRRYDINCAVAVAVELLLSDKVYNIIAKTCGHLSYLGS